MAYGPSFILRTFQTLVPRSTRNNILCLTECFWEEIAQTHLLSLWVGVSKAPCYRKHHICQVQWSLTSAIYLTLGNKAPRLNATYVRSL